MPPGNITAQALISTVYNLLKLIFSIFSANFEPQKNYPTQWI